MASIERPVMRQARGDATRQAILDAAERVFARLGYAAARLEDVALDVGIRRPSIVYYFPNKQQLYDEVEAGIFSAMHHYVVERLTGAERPMDQLLGLFDAWLDFLVARPTAARIIQRLIADLGPRGDNPVRFSETALVDIERVIAAGVAAGEFRPVSAMHILNGIAGGALFYVCNAAQLGEGRSYDPADPAQLEPFRALLHTLAKAAVRVE
ncbi:MAG: TetR/AcrR family transcriptional regulator [Pseudomonadota bacterium]